MSKNIVDLPSWLLKIIKNNAHDLPVVEEHISSFHHINHFFTKYENRYNALEKTRDFSILDAAEFQEEGKLLAKKPNNKEAVKLILLKYWEDQLEVADLYKYLTLIRGFHLIKSFVRAARTNDIFSMALLGRAILELGMVSADTMRKPLAFFKHLATTGKIPVTDDLQNAVEESLVKAIWGSRIGTGDLGDGKTNKPSTPLYDEKEILEGFVTAKNIMSAIKGRAKRIGGENGKSEYRIYEILSDLVHPSALGYQLLLHDNDNVTSSHGYRINKGDLHKDKANYAAMAAAFGAHQGCCLILEIDTTFSDVLKNSKKQIDTLKNLFIR